MSGRWEQLNPRERALAVIVAALLILGTGTIVTKRALARLDDLDRTIEQREEQILGYAKLLARSQSVGEAYAKVAAQHSSAWTEATIHDRLRNEIRRLLMKKPPPVGAPVSSKKEDMLLKMRALGQGSLRSDEEGFREYAITLRFPSTNMADLLTFLERLQQSPQSLRIDGLDISRPPTRPQISAVVDVTRTIVDGADNIPEAEEEVTFVKAARSLGAVEQDWKAEGCKVILSRENATLGPESVKAEATAASARLSLTEELGAGETHNLSMDIASSGPARIAVAESGSDPELSPGQDIIADGKMHRYTLRFTVPEGPDSSISMYAPAIILSEAGTHLYVDNVTLTRASG